VIFFEFCQHLWVKKKLDWGPYQMAKKDFDDKRVEEDQALRADCMDSDLTQCLQIPTSWVGYC